MRQEGQGPNRRCRDAPASLPGRHYITPMSDPSRSQSSREEPVDDHRRRDVDGRVRLPRRGHRRKADLRRLCIILISRCSRRRLSYRRYGYNGIGISGGATHGCRPRAGRFTRPPKLHERQRPANLACVAAPGDALVCVLIALSLPPSRFHPLPPHRTTTGIAGDEAADFASHVSRMRWPQEP